MQRRRLGVRGLRVAGLTVASRFDPAVQVGAGLHGEAPAHDVSFHESAQTDIHPVAGRDAADDGPEDRHRLCGDVSANRRVRADGQCMVGEVDAAFQLAVHHHVFGTGDVAFDEHAPYECRATLEAEVRPAIVGRSRLRRLRSRDPARFGVVLASHAHLPILVSGVRRRF